MTESNGTFYGVWINGKGWLRGKDVITFTNVLVANEVAKRVGNARVFYIDKSLEDIEQLLLQAEHRRTWSSLWRTFRTFLHLKQKSSDSNK